MTALAMLCTAVPMASVAEMSITASAEAAPTSGVCGDNLTWTIDTESGVFTVSGTGDMYDYDDTEAGRAPWYYYRPKVKKLVIKNGVTSVGAWAFNWCENMTAAVIPDSVQRFGECSFSACFKLSDIQIPDGVTDIPQGLFMNSRALQEVSFPDSVKTFGTHTFSYGGITSVRLPAGMRSIPASMFFDCDLTAFTIPDTVRSIGVNAFAQNELTAIEIPASVTFVDDLAFNKCAELEEITFLNPKCRIVDKNRTICNTYDYDTQEGSYTGVIRGYRGSTAEEYASKYGIRFSSLGAAPEIPYTCGDDLDWDLDDSGTLTISGTGDMYDFSTEDPAPWAVFPDEIKNVVVGQGVTAVGDYAFAQCGNLAAVSLPDGLTYVGEGAFQGCKSLREAVIPEGVTRIRPHLFADCKYLRSVIIPDSVTVIESNAFYGCENLCYVTVPENAAYVGRKTFAPAPFTLAQDEELPSVMLPDGLTDIGEAAFRGCKSLTSAVIPAGVTRIQACLFADCEKLESIVLPAGATAIGENAFSGCTALKSITIPKNVAAIGSKAFCDCAALDTVTIENPGCEISGDAATFCNSYDPAADTAVFEGTFYAAPDSAVKQYAEQSGYGFEAIAEVPQETERALGNVNDDEIVNASDAAVILIAAAAMGAGGESSLNEAQMQAADVNKDENVNASDAAIVLIYAASVGAGNTDAKITDFVK